MIKNLVTHSGSFHADDVFATSVLRKLFPDATIIRTREEQELIPVPDRIIYDVGGAHDPQAQIFDHHQLGAPVREDGSPYSSFGLIWETYGRAWLEAVMPGNPDNEKVHGRMGRTFIRDVDALDNGVEVPGGLSSLNITRIIETMTPDFDQPGADKMMECFNRAVDYAAATFEAATRTAAAKMRAERIMRQVLENHDGGPILELPFGMPWETALRRAKADNVLFVITPRDDAWQINGVNKEAGSFELRAALPERWAGLRGKDMAEASGVADAIFCHKARFIASARSREGVLELADLALAALPKEPEEAPGM